MSRVCTNEIRVALEVADGADVKGYQRHKEKVETYIYNQLPNHDLLAAW